ncbi:MAG: ABC transporter permease subunit [Candidatus Aminicenantales bacterium]|jgi:ABC-type transport system involved in multi-copper enzyme maturation permease subunit
MATVREKGYYHWDGQLAERRFPWLPITRTGILLAFKKRGFRFLFAGAFLPSVVFLAIIYISEHLADFKFWARGSEQFITITPGSFKVFLTNQGFLFLMIAMLVFAGAGLIADDLKHNSLQIYFSRPLRKKDYLLGKMAVVFFFILIVTLVPGLLVYIFKLIFDGSFKFFLDYPWLVLSIIGYTAMLAVFFAFYTLLLSALSKNSRYVMILVFMIYIFSDILYGILQSIFRTPYMSLFSIRANIVQVGAFVFAQKPSQAVPVVLSFLVLGGICGLSALVLNRKIRGVEVIR